MQSSKKPEVIVQNYERALETMGMRASVDKEEFVVEIYDLQKFKEWMDAAFRKALDYPNDTIQ